MSSLFIPSFAKAVSPLGRYRVLAPRASIHVSPLCLGAMSIGDKWEPLGMGSMDKQSSFELLDAFYEAGGNFIDTANIYQDGTSEEFIGEWAEQRGIRDQLILATKYTMDYKRGNDDIKQHVNYVGNNIKSMYLSVDASLKKLKTNYIDILYIHWWDWDTSIEEVMDGLHNLVVQGKVLYLGISVTPAWIVAQANQYAKYNQKTPFVIYQGAWSLLDRSFERDIIPMARSLGLALAPFGTLGGGKFRTDEEEERRRATGEKGRDIYGGGWERNEDERKISTALEKIAKEVGTKHITAVALAYHMQKTPYVSPIIGGRKVEHLKANIEGLKISLSPEQVKYLESVLPFDLGFPMNRLANDSSYNHLMLSVAPLDKMPTVQPIRPVVDMDVN